MWSVKPISSPKTSNILQQRSFTRVRSMGAAADESAHIPCIACKHVECASSLIVKRMVLCSPPRTNHQIELNEGFSTDDKRVWNVYHTFIISHTRNCLVTKNISLHYFQMKGWYYLISIIQFVGLAIHSVVWKLIFQTLFFWTII